MAKTLSLYKIREERKVQGLEVFTYHFHSYWMPPLSCFGILMATVTVSSLGYHVHITCMIRTGREHTLIVIYIRFAFLPFVCKTVKKNFFFNLKFEIVHFSFAEQPVLSETYSRIQKLYVVCLCRDIRGRGAQLSLHWQHHWQRCII